jgi:hypothetical protein
MEQVESLSPRRSAHANPVFSKIKLCANGAKMMRVLFYPQYIRKSGFALASFFRCGPLKIPIVLITVDSLDDDMAFLHIFETIGCYRDESEYCEIFSLLSILMIIIRDRNR